MTAKQIILITGERQIGKSTLCTRLVTVLREQHVHLTGLLTRHTGPHDLAVHELQSDIHYPITLDFETAAKQNHHLPRFIMDSQAMERASQALETSFPTQVFILDEIGPLELSHGKGWANAIDLMQEREYAVALVVIRPELLYEAMVQLKQLTYHVVHVTRQNRNMQLDTLRHYIKAQCKGANDG